MRARSGGAGERGDPLGALFVVLGYFGGAGAGRTRELALAEA